MLVRLHALLQVLPPTSRRKVIEMWMTAPQRKRLEHWVLEWRGRNHARYRSSSAHDDPDDLDGHTEKVMMQEEVETCALADTQARSISAEGPSSVASVYVKWLEILGPARVQMRDALQDHAALLLVKEHLLKYGHELLPEDLGLHILDEKLKQRGLELGLLRARVLVPVGFWLGTRLATPRGSLRVALQTRCRLRKHWLWSWWGAFQGELPPYMALPSHTTMSELWGAFRADFIAASVEAGVTRSHVLARLQRLEARQRMLHGDMDALLLSRVQSLLGRQEAAVRAAGERKAIDQRKRKRLIEKEQRLRAVRLRQRLAAERQMTMGEILDRTRCECKYQSIPA